MKPIKIAVTNVDMISIINFYKHWNACNQWYGEKQRDDVIYLLHMPIQT